MIIKVCGMKYPENIESVAALEPDFLGFIFYPKSPRYAEELDLNTMNHLPEKCKKIGVFVNEDLTFIKKKVEKYNLQGVQLHGKETPELCRILKEQGLIVLKAFSIAATDDFDATAEYEGTADYFLFDTKTPAYGGSGTKFDWHILGAYVGKTPFLLSGGISANDSNDVLLIEHPMFAGVDLNSRFEIEPGLKNITLLKQFFSLLSKR